MRLEDRQVASGYRDAIRALIPTSPRQAVDLAEMYVSEHLDMYEGATLFHLGELIERARTVRSTEGLTDYDIMTYVGDTNYTRAYEYMDRVSEVTTHDHIVAGLVHGTSSYETWASLDGSRIVGSGCTCPVRSDVCKHVGALLLYYVRTSPQVDTREATLREIVECL